MRFTNFRRCQPWSRLAITPRAGRTEFHILHVFRSLLLLFFFSLLSLVSESPTTTTPGRSIMPSHQVDLMYYCSFSPCAHKYKTQRRKKSLKNWSRPSGQPEWRFKKGFKCSVASAGNAILILLSLPVASHGKSGSSVQTRLNGPLNSIFDWIKGSSAKTWDEMSRDVVKALWLQQSTNITRPSTTRHFFRLWLWTSAKDSHPSRRFGMSRDILQVELSF